MWGQFIDLIAANCSILLSRYTRGDEDLPSWFAKDEAKHFRRPVNVPENLVQEYRTRLTDINVRTCKKVAEAKARKKRKAIKVMEKLRKKTEAITDNEGMTEKEKVANIKKYVTLCLSV